jgi:hypothetical protein
VAAEVRERLELFWFMDVQTTNTKPLLDEGEKIHVAARRDFEGDTRRHFVGTVTRVSHNAARADGYTFIFDNFKGQFSKRPEIRTRIISFVDANLIIRVLPPSVEISNVRYQLSSDRRLIMTDGGDFKMDIEEYNFKHG